MMSSLNFHHLRYFLALANEGNLARAARNLAVSQSALSTQIQALEARLGHPLFERVGRRLVQTEAGQIARDHAQAIFDMGDDLLTTPAGRVRAPSGAKGRCPCDIVAQFPDRLPVPLFRSS